MEAATFGTEQRSLPETQRAFAQKIAGAIVHHGGKRFNEQIAKDCLREAAEHSGWGRFALAHNYWMLPGQGDAGSFLLVRVQRDYSDPSGYRPEVRQYAKFSSLQAALDAWCKARGL